MNRVPHCAECERCQCTDFIYKDYYCCEENDTMRRYISNNNVKSCKEHLARLRRKGERNLKSKGKYVGYGAKLVKEPKDALSTYNIFTKGKKYSGNYTALCLRMGRLPKKD